MGATFSTLLLIFAPVSAGRQDTPPPPSVAEAEATVRKAQQVLEAARIFEAAERKRIAAEAEAATARATLDRLQSVPTAPLPAHAGLSLVKPTAVDPPDVSGPDIAPAVPDAAAIAAAQKGIVTTTTVTNGKTVTEVKPYSPTALAESVTNRQKFGGIDFGIGIAFSYDLGNHDRIRTAEIINNLVRVTQTDNVRARLMLETHYLFTPRSFLGIRNFFGTSNYDGFQCEYWGKGTDQAIDCAARRKNWGVGPFVAVQPSSNSIIDAVGLGLMMGFRRRADQPDGTNSFNIGMGVLYDIDVQMLGDGFVDGQAPPVGEENSVRFRRGSQSGLLIMSSYSF